MRKGLLGGLVGLMLAGGGNAVSAEDIALVISNQNYRFGGVVGTNSAASVMARDLRTQGWTVIAVGETDAPSMRFAAVRLRDALQSSPEADRVVVIVTARFGQTAR